MEGRRRKIGAEVIPTVVATEAADESGVGSVAESFDPAPAGVLDVACCDANGLGPAVTPVAHLKMQYRQQQYPIHLRCQRSLY